MVQSEAVAILHANFVKWVDLLEEGHTPVATLTSTLIRNQGHAIVTQVFPKYLGLSPRNSLLLAETYTNSSIETILFWHAEAVNKADPVFLAVRNGLRENEAALRLFLGYSILCKTPVRR